MSEISIINRVAVGDLLRRTASRHGDRTAIVDGEIRLSYTALNEQVNRIGHYFQKQGLKTGDRVATVCANSSPIAQT
jgi:long-chain acyl-CoA synthetase